MTDPIRVGSPLRDAAADPQPDDLAPMREVRGHPGVFKRAEVGEPAYYAAVAAARRAAATPPDQAPPNPDRSTTS